MSERRQNRLRGSDIPLVREGEFKKDGNLIHSEEYGIRSRRVHGGSTDVVHDGAGAEALEKFARDILAANGLDHAAVVAEAAKFFAEHPELKKLKIHELRAPGRLQSMFPGRRTYTYVEACHTNSLQTTLSNWPVQVGIWYGKIGPIFSAALYLERKRQLLSGGVTAEALHEFGEAYYWLRMDLTKDHTKAIAGVASVSARKKGSAVNNANAKRRDEILAEHVGPLLGKGLLKHQVANKIERAFTKQLRDEGLLRARSTSAINEKIEDKIGRILDLSSKLKSSRS